MPFQKALAEAGGFSQREQPTRGFDRFRAFRLRGAKAAEG